MADFKLPDLGEGVTEAEARRLESLVALARDKRVLRAKKA